MDDITLFADDRQTLEIARRAVIEWLRDERRLVLKHPAAPVRSTKDRFTYLGFRINREGLDPRPAALARMRRRLRHLLLHGQLDTLRRSLASYRGLVGLTGSGSGDLTLLSVEADNDVTKRPHG